MFAAAGLRDTFIIHRPQGLDEGPQPQGKPGNSAPQLPPRSSIEGRLPASPASSEWRLGTHSGRPKLKSADLTAFMLGRAAYHAHGPCGCGQGIFSEGNPRQIESTRPPPCLPTSQNQLRRGLAVKIHTPHAWTFSWPAAGAIGVRSISEQSHLPGAGIEVLRRGLEAIETQSNRSWPPNDGAGRERRFLRLPVLGKEARRACRPPRRRLRNVRVSTRR